MNLKCGADSIDLNHFNCRTSISKSKNPTVVPVPEVVCVADGVDGEVVDDTARGHVRVSLRVNVGVTFPRLPRPELCTNTRSRKRFSFFPPPLPPVAILLGMGKLTWRPGDSVSMGRGRVGTGRPAIAHRAQ